MPHRQKLVPSPRRLRLVAVEQIRLPDSAPIRIHKPSGAVTYARRLLANKDREHFVVLHLDAKHHVASAELTAIGTLSSAPVHPREIYKAAILANAAAIIAAHNHPSGDPEPSREDLSILDRLRTASELVGIPLLDFLVIAGSHHWSASEAGKLRRPT